jgi:hypothetical protein
MSTDGAQHGGAHVTRRALAALILIGIALPGWAENHYGQWTYLAKQHDLVIKARTQETPPRSWFLTRECDTGKATLIGSPREDGHEPYARDSNDHPQQYESYQVDGNPMRRAIDCDQNTGICGGPAAFTVVFVGDGEGGWSTLAGTRYWNYQYSAEPKFEVLSRKVVETGAHAIDWWLVKPVLFIRFTKDDSQSVTFITAGFREALAEYCDAEPIPYTEFAGRK